MHTIKHKRALITRVRRVRGQINAVERALDEERGCELVIQMIATVRGAINALAAEVLCEHLISHVAAPRARVSERARAAAELETVIRQLVSRRRGRTNATCGTPGSRTSRLLRYRSAPL